MKAIIKKNDLVVIFVFVISLLFYYLFLNSPFVEQNTIYILCVIGWVELLFCIITMKIKSGHYFSLYTIFLIFAFLFTYGQCLMWSFGIHTDHEIGKVPLYTFPAPTDSTIIKTQIITLIGLLAFHFGAIISFRNKTSIKAVDETIVLTQRKALKYASWISNVFSTPLMFYSILRAIKINDIYGYGATLNNVDVVASQNNILMLLRLMYIPSLIGLLIAYKYRMRIMVYCYTSFSIFTLFSLIAGDRGEWLFPLLFFIWMHHNYYSKLNSKKMLFYVITALGIIVVSVAIRDSRANGFSFDVFLHTLIDQDTNPLVSAIFELGGSMRPTMVFVQNDWNCYPFGNSYLLAFGGMITERPLRALIPGYKSISYWFSSDYLGIRYGAGFSFVAEAFSNYGPYLFWIALFAIGVLFAKTLFFAENRACFTEPVISFWGLSTANCMILSIRNALNVSLKYWVYSTISIIVIYYVLFLFFDNRSRKVF